MSPRQTHDWTGYQFLEPPAEGAFDCATRSVPRIDVGSLHGLGIVRASSLQALQISVFEKRESISACHLQYWPFAARAMGAGQIQTHFDGDLAAAAACATAFASGMIFTRGTEQPQRGFFHLQAQARRELRGCARRD